MGATSIHVQAVKPCGRQTDHCGEEYNELRLLQIGGV